MYELDEVVWFRNESKDCRRTDEEIELIYSKIIESEAWTIENGGRPCFNQGLHKADLIVVLDLPRYIIAYRIIKRWVFQNLGIEYAHYKPSLSMLRQMFIWSKGYQTNKAEKMKEWEQFNETLLIIHCVRQIDSYLT